MPIKFKEKIMAALGGGVVAIAIVLIAHFEGYESRPYRDVAGVLTVCYGHTGSDIVEGKEYSINECEELLKKDLAVAQKTVDRLVTYPLNDVQRAALYSFTYNVGIGAFQNSTLLKKLNAGDLDGACNQLRRWTYSGGKKWRGLEQRREIELQLCKQEKI